LSNLSKCKPEQEGSAIFTENFWANQSGTKAINAQGNRDKAEAVMLFGQTYFNDHFPSKHPVIHTDMLALMNSDNKLKAVAYPRGHAKSTVITFLLALYRIVFQERKFIVIVSDSEDKAKDFVIRIRNELEFNAKLKRDFTQTGEFKSIDWAKTDFTTSTGIRVVAKGAGQSMRGLLHKDTRPDMIVLDDIETNETAGTDSVLHFILTDVLPSVNKRGIYDVCYVGTILRDMSCLHRILTNPEWTSAKYEAVNEDGDMIAPMLLPKSEYEKAKRMYQELGKMSVFYSEMHNNPMVADDELTFKHEYFQHIENKDVPEGCNYYIAYDPAMPPSGRTKIKKVDKSALIVLATDSKENWYVVKVFANRGTPQDNRKLLINLMKKYQPKVTWIETIAAQRAMYLEIKKYMQDNNVKYPLREIYSHKGSKEGRIEQLQPLYESGRIYHISKQDQGIQDLERELMLFTRTPHDDISDCLSFFIGQVKYPRDMVSSSNTVIDPWAKYFKKDVSADWKIL
jgi:predicted phage terminase large subunit-like protein